ncbi:MAG: FAD-dependent oxidoreductase [Candidatus Nanosynbacter sp.]|jgi:D amino acid oxidase (DAO) family protein|uniref:FAD-dependent oxidoreductase n=1 Tax=Candidatus Minimicrobia sp. QA0096 TaxID=3118470 RepID=UPI001CAAB416|nr:FAD-dependent oxidoreductase [Candidatus Nanosynbacter sp.]MBF1039953.1 FAD-dependent oxidoreductase [Candidatus Nanosynbacter sp.]
MNSTVIIGGGFYGLRIALYLHEELGVDNIIIIEKETALMDRASYVNQARIHNGYHYPRSVLTGFRSAVNFPVFVDEYGPAVVSNFEKYYGIAKHLSKVNAKQFEHFCEKIGSEIERAPHDIEKMFNPSLIEEVFKVKEYAFNSRKLRELLVERINKYKGISIHTGESVSKIELPAGGAGKINVVTDRDSYEADFVLNCTYSNINTLHRASGLPLVGLKHEITEMCLVELPQQLKDFSITVMDGPFFSIMPFPSKNLYTLSHVRYTPHESWIDDENTSAERIKTHEYLKNRPFKSNYRQMYNDVVRFIPALKNMKYRESIVEVKTVLVKSEDDDSRPILFRNDFGNDGYICIMGGKLDNIYDAFEELRRIYGQEKAN